MMNLTTIITKIKAEKTFNIIVVTLQGYAIT